MQAATMMATKRNSDQLWALVLDRSTNADGEFVYAVKSTGVFCRPSCPSRRPRREQVEFFDSPGDAQQAGYRACRRCCPLQRNAQMEKVEAACRYIEQNLEETLGLEQIASAVGLSPFHFQRLFKRALGISPREYQQAQRAGKFKQALQSESRITDAIYEAGYSSSSRAYENSNRHLGMTPTAFRRRGEGVRISYTIVSSELGKLLIATTSKGVCAVRFGDSERKLEQDLRHEFDAAEISRQDKELREIAGTVQNLFTNPASANEIPLDIQGTAFQQRVWSALRMIPRGETRSYTDVARQIGSPRAVRAVANACGSNPAAVVIPCHRVVQKNGSMAGYRWGVERKAALLRAEQTSTTETQRHGGNQRH